MLGSVEALLGRSKNQVRNLDRSQELEVLHDELEVK